MLTLELQNARDMNFRSRMQYKVQTLICCGLIQESQHSSAKFDNFKSQLKGQNMVITASFGTNSQYKSGGMGLVGAKQEVGGKGKREETKLTFTSAFFMVFIMYRSSLVK